jgi:cell surface protein SprA
LNELDITLKELTDLKVSRNGSSSSHIQYFKKTDAKGKELAILGDPNLGEIRVMYLGVENRLREVACTEVWVNELRLGGIDENSGWAALGRVDMKLADLGTLYVSGSAHSTGFGSLEQRVSQRSRDNFTQFDVATNLELGKLLPQNAGLSIPVYASLQQVISSPEYDPYDLDIKLQDKLSTSPASKRDSIRKNAVEFNSIKTINFTNVKKSKTNGKSPKIYDVENVDISYSYIKTSAHSPLVEYNEVTKHRGALGYNFAPQPTYVEPFRGIFKKSKSYLDMKFYVDSLKTGRDGHFPGGI